MPAPDPGYMNGGHNRNDTPAYHAAHAVRSSAWFVRSPSDLYAGHFWN